MSRLSDLKPTDLTSGQRRVYDDIIAGPRGKISGPFNALLRSPGVAGPSQELGAFLRFDATLAGRLRELAVLVTARYWKAQFEWYAHTSIARSEGLAQSIIDAIAARQMPEFTDDAENIVYQFCTELLNSHVVGDELYAATLAQLDETGIVELVAIVGYYSLVSMTLNTFQVAPPADVKLLD